MKSIQKKTKQAFENATPNILGSILSDCAETKTDVIPMSVKRSRPPILRIVATAAVLVLLVGVGAMAASMLTMFGGTSSKPPEPNLEEHSHLFENKITKEPTCTDSGTMQKFCCEQNCDCVIFEVIPPNGHTWNTSSDGSRLCSICGFVESEHTHEYALLSSSVGNDETPDIATFQCTVCKDLMYTYTGKSGQYDLEMLLTELEAHARSMGFSLQYDPSGPARHELSYSELFRVLEAQDGYRTLKEKGFELISILHETLNSQQDPVIGPVQISIVYLEDAERTIGAFRIQIFAQ